MSVKIEQIYMIGKLVYDFDQKKASRLKLYSNLSILLDCENVKINNKGVLTYEIIC